MTSSLRDLVAEIIEPHLGMIPRSDSGLIADRILAIPEIAEALKAYAFATAAVRATGGGVEKSPDMNRKVTRAPSISTHSDTDTTDFGR